MHLKKFRETIVNKIALSDRQREQMLSANKIGLENPKQFINKLEDPFVNKIALSDRQREQMLSANKIGLENPKQFINKLEDPCAGMNLNTFLIFANPDYQPAHSAISPVRQIEVAQRQESIQALIKEVQ